MDFISRISKIQGSLRELVDDLEALKQELVGEDPVKLNPRQFGILDQMRDLISRGGAKDQHG
jgi:hypothetical protein